MNDRMKSFDALLDYLKDSRGFDFSGYKPGTLQRRIEKRMQEVSIAGFADYIDFLEVHPEEFTTLFNTILINVTGFFRDPEAWAFLAENVIPKIAEGESAIRVMSAGCASGQEAYTIAILLAEALGEEQFRNRVKIYGTDLDEEALAQARRATYSYQELVDVPDGLRETYFKKSGDSHVFRPDMRRSLIFGKHNLMRDAPISRLDLIVCRNTLMYFNGGTQKKIIEEFHYSLKVGGFLFLGKAEMLLSQGALFSPLDLKHRIFTRANGSYEGPRIVADMDSRGAKATVLSRLEFDRSSEARILVDAQGLLALANARARALFGLLERDLGRPFSDLEVSYRPADLRTPIQAAFASRSPQSLPQTPKHLSSGESRYYDITVAPLGESGKPWAGASITFQDCTAQHEADVQLLTLREELETRSQELQSSNEELETTNEELQSTVEELQTTNEELQSTNEEMETMNEELQASNNELQEMNEALHKRTSEARQANAFLESVLASLDAAVIAVNAEMVVSFWNTQASNMWGVRTDEAQGQALKSLDIGLALDALEDLVRLTLGNTGPVIRKTLPATNRKGKSIQCRITCTLTSDTVDGKPVVVLLMEEEKT